MVKIINTQQVDVNFSDLTNEYLLDYKTSSKGVDKKINFIVEGKEIIKSSVTCGCTKVEDLQKNSFSINYDVNRIGRINQVVTLTYKDGSTSKIRLAGVITE